MKRRSWSECRTKKCTCENPFGYGFHVDNECPDHGSKSKWQKSLNEEWERQQQKKNKVVRNK